MTKGDTTASGIEAWLQTNQRLVVRLVAVFGVLTVLAYFLPALLKPTVYTNDMAEWTSWSYRFRDAALFPNDPHAAYWTANFPAGYALFFRLLAPLIDPQLLGEGLGMAFGGAVVWLAFLLGRHLCGGRLAGAIAAVLLVFIGQFTHFDAINLLNREAGGLPRGGALPILMAGYLCLLQGRRWAYAMVLLLGAVVYPPTVIMLGALAGLLVAWRLVSARRWPADAVWLLVPVVLAVAIAAAFSAQASQINGRLFTLAEMLQMSAYRPGGILPLFPEHPWQYVTQAFMLNAGLPAVVWLAVMLAAFGYAASRGDRRLIRAEVLLLPLSALANYTLAYLVMFRMYEPSRYTMFAYQLLTMVVVIWGADRLVSAWRGGPSAVQVRRSWVLVMVVAIVGVNGANFALRYMLNRGGMSDNMPADVYRFVETLPKDTLIGAMPTVADRIPMRAKRQVLVMNTSFYPYNRAYYEANLARFDALVAALAARDGHAMAALHQRFGVDYVVFDTNAPIADPLTQAEPLKSRAAAIGAGPLATSYAVAQARDHAVFRSGSFAVIKIANLGR